MHLDGAADLAATLRSAAATLDAFAADLAGPVQRAVELVGPAWIGASTTPGRTGLDELARLAATMASDLEWRIEILAEGDRTSVDAAGYAVGALPPRTLDLVAMPLESLIDLLRADPPGREALLELAARAAAEPPLALQVVTGLRTAGLAAAFGRFADDHDAADALGTIVVMALTLGDSAIVRTIEDATVRHHFAEQDRHLAILRSEWTTFDGAVTGDPDGLVSSADVAAIAAADRGEASVTAAWLLADPDLMAALDTGRRNRDYFSNGGESLDAGSGGDDRISDDDVLWYRAKRDAAFFLTSIAAAVDTAADPVAPADGFRSEDDWRTAREWEWLSPRQQTSIDRILADDAWDRHPSNLGIVILDGVSYVPVLGDGVDATVALYYLAHGDLANAAAYGVGLVPIPGVSSGAISTARRTLAELGEVAAREGGSAVGRRIARDTAREYATDKAADAASEKVAEVVADTTGDEYLGRAAGVATDAAVRRGAEGGSGPPDTDQG